MENDALPTTFNQLQGECNVSRVFSTELSTVRLD